jgi:hypothetical protein
MNQIEQLVALGFQKGTEAMKAACVEWLRAKAHTESLDAYPVEAAALRRAAKALEALPAPEMGA